MLVQEYLKNKEHYLRSKDKAEKWYDVSRHIQLIMSKYKKKWRYTVYYVPVIVSSWNFQELLPLIEVMSMQKAKIRGQRSRSQRSKPNLAVSGLQLQFEVTHDDEMMHKGWCGIGDVPFRFFKVICQVSRSHNKIHQFWPKWRVSKL